MTIRKNPLGRINDLAIRRWEVEHDLTIAIDEATEAGATWAEVGSMLGVTKQAAHARYAPLVDELRRQRRVTERKAKRAAKQAAAEQREVVNHG